MRCTTRLPALTVGLALAFHLTSVSPASAWWNQNWTRRVKLTFLNGGQPESFANFPVMIRLDASRIDYGDTQNAGQDVRFVDADDATLLSHEIELWNESGSSFVWVKVPQVDASSNTDFIWMYYGNPMAADGQSPAAVWDASFRMVLHLKETAGAHFDSTSNGNNSVSIEITTQGSAAGRIDGADGFSATDDIEVADAASLDIGAAESMTLEAWIRTSNAAGGQMIVSKEDPAGGEYQLWTDTGNARFWLHDGTNVARANSATNVANDAWHYVVGRWSEATSTAEVFVGGTSVASASNPALGALSGGRDLRIGEEADSDPDGGFNFQGTIDEVRLSKVARSDNWIRAQHLSMNDSFVSFGGPSPVGAMRVKSGSYSGNGTDDRAIFVGFQPDVVIIKRDANCGACGNPEDFIGVLRTSTMAGDATKSLDYNTGLALFAGGVKSLTTSGFTLGTSARVNGAGQTYHWIAFQAGQGVLKVGTYTGTGPDNRSVTGIGFEPELVITLPAAGGFPAGVPWFRTSTMPADRSYHCDSNGFTNKIQIMEPDGFQVGTDQNVNTATYHYVAWNASPGSVAVGSYTGTGVDPTNYDVAGFFPEWVLIKLDTNARPWVHKPASTGVSTSYQLTFSEFGGVADNVHALRPLGFQVDDHERVNSVGNTYHWAAFGPHTPTINLRSIGDTGTTYGTGPGASAGNGTTVSVVNGSNLVTGVGGPMWVAANRGRGDAITIPCPDPPTCTGGAHSTIGAVSGQTSLELTGGYAGATSGSVSYLIRRQFASPAAWEDCIDGGGTSCGLFPSVPSANLVTDDRREVGIVYDDVLYTAPLNGFVVRIMGATTDAEHTITLTADGVNRHYGIPGNGARFDQFPGSGSGDLIEIRTRFVIVEWLEFRGDRTGADAIEVSVVPAAGKVIVRNNLIQNVGAGVQIQDPQVDVDVYNNIIYRSGKESIGIDEPVAAARILNNTIYDAAQEGIYGDPSGNLACAPTCTYPTVILRNNLVHTTADPNYSVPGLSPLSSHNLSSDGTATAASPAGGGRPGVPLSGAGGVNFVDPVPASKDLHLLGTSFAIDKAADLSGVFGVDVDFGLRSGVWDIGADEAGAATQVTLASFEARGANRGVELFWETASELNNLGFHLHRAGSESGPYERITTRLVPGLGSSPEGARYRWVDSGLSNGATYYYKLEDVETTGRTKLHGPVSATPTPSSTSSAVEGEESLITYGRPDANAFRVLSRRNRRVVVELVTEGFYAEPQEDGTVLLEIPGFEALPGPPSVPVLRPWVDVPQDLDVRVLSTRVSSTASFAGLRPSGGESLEIVASPRGTVRARRAGRAGGFGHPAALVPADPVRLLQVGFQGEAKKAQLELAPLRWDGRTGELVLARRLTVELELEGRVERRVRKRGTSTGGDVLARLATTEEGLHEISYEELFRGRRGGRVGVESLRLSRQGRSVAFHVEPAGRPFGAGSKLYFVGEGADANAYGNELVYELSAASGGLRMALGSATPKGEPVGTHLASARFEENRYYQAGLLEAEDLWLWDLLLAPVAKSFPFRLDDVAPGASQLTVWLQGVSDLGADPDHHVRIFVNGSLQAERSWDGKRAERVALELPPALLLEGENVLEIENVGDTGASYSMVMVDRFELVHPRGSVAREGRIEGQWVQSGAATIAGIGAAHVLDVTGESPRWLSGGLLSPDGSFHFLAEAGRRYLAVARNDVRRPEVRAPSAPRLSRTSNRADYVVIGPSELLPVAAPLLEHRSRQGLAVMYAAIEDVFAEFGFGETSPEAIRRFLRFAYENWSDPKPRYVLLVGDATYDFKDYLKAGTRNQVPTLLVKTSYLWTASDPTLAAVHGDDLLPDVAVGRLPAKGAEELRRMVEKILAYEHGEADLSSFLVLVTDNPDAAGDFDANAKEIAEGVLRGRDVRRISVAELGAAARGEIVGALDEGASLLSYIGHGGIHLWADENVFNTSDVPSLGAQPQQPLLLTMNCLNGYFHFPWFDSLAEALVKAESKGAVAAFSPSGLSLDAPAHRYHVALLDEIFRKGHARLGDAVLAAQASYAESGAFPELLSIYHLLGDPGLALR